MGQTELFNDREKIKEDFKAGKKYTHIAEEYGIGTKEIRFFLMGLGFKMSFKSGKPRKFNHEEAIRMYVDLEFDLEEVAEKLNTNVPAIKAMFRRKGIRLRPSFGKIRKKERTEEQEMYLQPEDFELMDEDEKEEKEEYSLEDYDSSFDDEVEL